MSQRTECTSLPTPAPFRLALGIADTFLQGATPSALIDALELLDDYTYGLVLSRVRVCRTSGAMLAWLADAGGDWTVRFFAQLYRKGRHLSDRPLLGALSVELVDATGRAIRYAHVTPVARHQAIEGFRLATNLSVDASGVL